MAAIAAPAIGAVVGETVKAVYSFTREYSENLKICKVFGGLYPSESFLTLEVGYCIGAGGERKNKKLYLLRLATINGGAPFPSTEDDKYIVSLFLTQMALLKEEIIGQKMRHTWGRGIKDEVEAQVWMDIRRLVIYVIFGALHSTLVVPSSIRAAADVPEKKRRPSDEEQESIEVRFLPVEQLIVSVFLSCDPGVDDDDEKEDYTAHECVDMPMELNRFEPVSSFDIEEQFIYAETESSSADSSTDSSADQSDVKQIIQQLRNQVQSITTQMKDQAEQSNRAQKTTDGLIYGQSLQLRQFEDKMAADEKHVAESVYAIVNSRLSDDISKAVDKWFNIPGNQQVLNNIIRPRTERKSRPLTQEDVQPTSVWASSSGGGITSDDPIMDRQRRREIIRLLQVEMERTIAVDGRETDLLEQVNRLNSKLLVYQQRETFQGLTLDETQSMRSARGQRDAELASSDEPQFRRRKGKRHYVAHSLAKGSSYPSLNPLPIVALDLGGSRPEPVVPSTSSSAFKFSF